MAESYPDHTVEQERQRRIQREKGEETMSGEDQGWSVVIVRESTIYYIYRRYDGSKPNQSPCHSHEDSGEVLCQE